MNFLAMVQRVAREAGVSGTITSVVNQRGEAERIVTWVAQAYQDICLDQPMQWDFLRGREIKQLTAGKGVYSAADLGITDLAQWDRNNMRVALREDMRDETFLTPRNWKTFYDYWVFSSRRSLQSRPLEVAVGQQVLLHLGPIPSADYWLAFDYDKRPDPLTTDTDEPLIPERFHMIIVWRALRSYGLFESAPEVVMRADAEYNAINLRLVIDQTPNIEIADPLC